MPAVHKTIFWEPYGIDPYTVALFHFDHVSADSSLAVHVPPVEPLSQGLPLGSATEGLSVRTVPNAAPMSAGLALSGACGVTNDGGRFGAGLRFEGGDARAAGSLPRSGARTIEFWALLEALPREKAVVLSVSSPRPSTPPIVFGISSDGDALLEWAGKSYRLPAEPWTLGVWRHVALGWDGRTRVEVRLDGNQLDGEWRRDSKFGAEHTHYVLGNNPEGNAGFQGRLDEVRCSSVIRDYYPYRLGWVDRAGQRPHDQGPPYFRSADDLLLHLDFNQRLQPRTAPPEFTVPAFDAEAYRRTRELDPEKTQRLFAEGVEREGVILHKDGVDLQYRGKGFLRPDRGTIAFWIRPLNWNNEVRWNPFLAWPMKTVPIFQVQAGDGRPCIRLALIQTPHEDTCAYPIELHPGTWIHIAIGWEGKRTWFYVNGQRWTHGGSWQWSFAPWDEQLPLRVSFGRDESGCVLDDWRAYGRLLSPGEIANLVALYDRRAELRPLVPMEMEVHYNGVAGRVDADLYLLTTDPMRVAHVWVGVTRVADGRLLGETTGVGRGATHVYVRVATPPMDFGPHEVHAVAQDTAGGALFECRTTFDRQPPPWWKNRLGLSDRVMPDWTPVRVSGHTVSVSLRDIELSDAALPLRIRSAGGELLAAPVSLSIAEIGDPEESSMEPLPGAFRSRTQGEVAVETEGEARRGRIRAHVSGRIEFDGMMWFSITLTGEPGSDPILRTATVRVPYDSESAKFIHWWSGNHGFRDRRVVHIGALSTSEGCIFRSDAPEVRRFPMMTGSFIPYVMLCGDRRGMAWFAENDQGWTPGTNGPAVFVERRGRSVVLTLRVITEPVQVRNGRTFAFGLHPIPVRPLVAGWRATPCWGVWPDSFCGFNLKGGAATDFFRHPDRMDWNAVEARFRGRDGTLGKPERMEDEYVRGFRKLYGRDPLPHERIVYGLYYDLRRIDAFPDHTREWGEVWPTRRFTPEIVDYSVWIWNEWLRRGYAKGVYMDDCYNAPLEHEDADVTYRLPDGQVQPGFQWLGQREMLKRFRQVAYDNGLSPRLCAHTTHTYFIPYHSFFDVILDGEDFYQMPQETRDFMDSWPPDRLRFMHPEKWGPVSTWLGWTSGGVRVGLYPTWAYRHTRAYVAALLVHDLIWTVGLGNYVTGLDRDWVVRSRVRVDPSVVFVPYWDPQGAFEHGVQGLYVSAWYRPGWCAVALANWTTNRLEASVRLNLDRLGFPGHPWNATRAQDVDPALLTSLDSDVSAMTKPDVTKMDLSLTGEKPLAAVALGVDDQPSVQRRKENEADAWLEWRDGILRCAVRPHDFRLIELTSDEGGG